MPFLDPSEGQVSEVRADILFRWDAAGEVDPGSDLYAIAYVRPESNRVVYESEIAKAIKQRMEILYIANLNGRLFTEGGILRSHYASQFRFAEDPRTELEAYPEVAAAFEAHFGLPAGHADIRGSLQGLEDLGLSPERLFTSIVPDSDFLAAFGQTFKRIGGVFIVNYDLPALIARYRPDANVFVLCARRTTAGDSFYAELNRSIYEAIISRPDTPLLFGAELEGLGWEAMVRRTYHVSTGRLMAMLDMSEFVFVEPTRRLDVAATPLGRALVEGQGLPAELLRAAKRRQLCRVAPPGKDPAALVYLPHAGAGLDAGAMAAVFARAEPWLD
jgi:hypothetical protein